MKNLFIILLLLLLGRQLSAQTAAGVSAGDLPLLAINGEVSLHVISPEPIRYVDISTHAIAGDLPASNILRLKVIPDSAARLASGDGRAGVVTIVGESFIAQYRLVYSPGALVPAQVSILPEQARPLDVPGISLSTPDMWGHALDLLKDRRHAAIRKAEAYGIRVQLNQVCTIGDRVFLDITYRNESGLPYDIDEMRFKIEDKKITKATNVQSIELKPEWQLYPLASFKKTYRNIYVLKKVSFPENKILNIELTEKQISGRTVTLQVKYKDILKADTF